MFQERRNSPFRRRTTIEPVENDVVVYGTTWCGMTQLVRRYLDKMEIPYRFLDLDNDPEAETQLRWITGGYKNHPTVVINGQALIEPDIDEIEETLTRNGYL